MEAGVSVIFAPKVSALPENEALKSTLTYMTPSFRIGLQALAVLDEADPLLSVVADRVLFPVFEEVLQDLRGVCLEVGVAGDPGVELILPVCEGLAGLGQLGGRALDVLALDADVEAVGALFDHFGELAVVLLEHGLALRHAALGVDDLLLELFLCHGGLLSSWPGQSRGSWWCRVPEKQKHDRRIASESSAEGVRSSSMFSVGVVWSFSCWALLSSARRCRVFLATVRPVLVYLCA